MDDIRIRQGDFVHRWTRELTQQLILWRVANKDLFTGKRNAALKGFEVFIQQMGLEGKVSVASVKKKWENLKQKYKALKNPTNGRSTLGGVTADTWTWYRAMDEALEFSHSITCVTVGSSSADDGTVFSVPSEGSPAASSYCLSSTTAPNSPLKSTATSNSCLDSIATSDSSLNSTTASTSILNSITVNNSALNSTTVSDSSLNSTATSNSSLNLTTAPSSCLNSITVSNSCLKSTAVSNSFLNLPTVSNSCLNSITASSSSGLVFLQKYEQVNVPIAVQEIRPITTGYVLKWTDELVEQLILWRVANKNYFTGKRNTARQGFEVFIKEMELEGKVTVTSVKKKWENLKQKYKELKNPPNGVQGGVNADSWKWFRAMDEALDFSESTTCLTVGSSTAADEMVFSIPSEVKAAVSSLNSTTTTTSNFSLNSTAASRPSLNSTAAPISCLNATAAPNSSLDSTAASNSSLKSTAASNTCLGLTAASSSCFSPTTASYSSSAPEPPPTSPAPKRAKKEPEWLLAIKELERREEARDARQAEWERAMMEREKRRDRETMEREERRDQEMKEREERRDREMKEREERLITENREREDRQAKEAAAREERFLALMDFLVKK